MRIVDYTRARIAAALEEVDRLLQSDFPSQHPKDAIDILQSRFTKRASVLNKIGPNVPPHVLQTECSASLEQLFVYVPILGFILRSTNVRNGFEAYGPLLRLAECLMGYQTKLIVSSEWEFSPFVYRSITDLPGFVLIGLPATESSNPLVIPLAGHELGHSMWETNKLAGHFNSRIRQSILSEITDKKWNEYERLFPQYKKDDLDGNWLGELTWEPASKWCLLQAEEMFCDFLGVRLFAESYLYAFAYLIAPGTGGERSVGYPNIKRRVSHLIAAADVLGVTIPPGFADGFMPETEPVNPTTAFLVSIADTVTTECASDLLKKAQELADSKVAPARSAECLNRIAEGFKQFVVPTAESEALVDITCAGWKCYLDTQLWDHIRQIERKDWGRVLRDLIYKSMEVSEICWRLEKAQHSREHRDN
jgi:hypothetical protein